MYLLILPALPYLRRKYPREYWEAKFKDIQNHE